MVFNVM